MKFSKQKCGGHFSNGGEETPSGGARVVWGGSGRFRALMDSCSVPNLYNHTWTP